MSFTYAHYQGPSSLPSDYAILSALNERSHDPDSDTGSVSDADTLHPAVGRRLAHRKSFPHAYYYRPAHPTIGSYPRRDHSPSSTEIPTRVATPTETTPLLSNPPVPRIEEQIDNNDCSAEQYLTFRMFWEEFLILAKYSLPVFGYALFLSNSSLISPFIRTHVLEYSLVIVSVVSIGHISTSALAAISLGSMTASVSGFSIIQGLASALDTLLPSAWTSSQPQLVGLWAQRMSTFSMPSDLNFKSKRHHYSHRHVRLPDCMSLESNWMHADTRAFSRHC